MTPRERGDRALQLLDDPVLTAALADIRDGLVKSIESSAMSDAEAHHELAISLQLLKQVRVQLRKYADETTVENARERERTFIAKMRQSIKFP